MDTGELIQTIVEKPSYKKGPRKKRKLTEEMITKIKLHLEENQQKKQRSLRKQLKKPGDIHETLESEGCDISYSTVLRTIKSLEKVNREAFIKGDYIPEDICEFDWVKLN